MWEIIQHYASISYAVLVSALMLFMVGAFFWAHAAYSEQTEKPKFDPLKAEGTAFLPCFYCGADEKQLKFLLVSLIGTFLLGSLTVLFWSWYRGTFKNIEKAKFNLFDLERRD